MERHKNLPFAMYDLAVYLPGGIVFLALVQIALYKFGLDFRLPLFHDGGDQIGTFVRGLIWLSLGYLVGHLLSFLSSYFIEKLVHGYLGYPAMVWLHFEEYFSNPDCEFINNKEHFIAIRSNFKENIVFKIILFAQLPAANPLFFLFYFGFLGFYSPKLPLRLKNRVAQNILNLKTGIPIEAGSRWDKLVEHYVSNNVPSAYGRMYNYLIIYGALRMMACIILISLWFIFIYSSFYWLKFGISLHDISIKLTILYLVLVVSYTISIMAFSKFNRRYFEESILAFCLCKVD